MLRADVHASHDGQTLPLHNRSLWYTVLFVLVCHLLVATGCGSGCGRGRRRWPPGSGTRSCLTAAMVLAPEQGQTFIYFTF